MRLKYILNELIVQCSISYSEKEQVILLVPSGVQLFKTILRISQIRQLSLIADVLRPIATQLCVVITDIRDFSFLVNI